MREIPTVIEVDDKHLLARIADLERELAECRAAQTPTPPPPQPLPSPGTSRVSINCGGAAIMDWIADTHFSAPGSATHIIQNPPAQLTPVYRTMRVSGPSGRIAYSVPVTPGRYDVIMDFTESFHRVAGTGGKRVFSIHINGQEFRKSFDLSARGLHQPAQLRGSDVIAQNNRVEVVLQGITDSATICGLRVIPAGL